MVTKDEQHRPARDRTDEDLRAERQKTDDAFARNQDCEEQRADDVVDRARERADETLGAARAKSDAKLETAGASAEVLATVKAQQTGEDTVLSAERRTADFLLEGEREQRVRAISSLLHVERAETDKHLLLERALIDERLARILAELAESVKLRDAFIAEASHELKTPLTPLALRLQALSREAAKQPASPFAQQVSAYVDTAKRQIEKFSALVADLLDVTRITSGKLTLELESVDLGAVVGKVGESLRPQAHRVGSVLEVEAPTVIGRWDELLVERTVTSLLENAIKYGSGRPIRVRLQKSSEFARLTVQDEGIGIAPEHLSRIFGRFERAVSSWNYGGFGLGLYTTRTVVEAMGGTVEVRSELGCGSTFTVELPLVGPTPA